MCRETVHGPSVCGIRVRLRHMDSRFRGMTAIVSLMQFPRKRESSKRTMHCGKLHTSRPWWRTTPQSGKELRVASCEHVVKHRHSRERGNPGKPNGCGKFHPSRNPLISEDSTRYPITDADCGAAIASGHLGTCVPRAGTYRAPRHEEGPDTEVSWAFPKTIRELTRYGAQVLVQGFPRSWAGGPSQAHLPGSSRAGPCPGAGYRARECCGPGPSVTDRSR